MKQEAEEALARILASEEMRLSPILRKILDYVVTEELQGRGENLKAYSIGLDALGKHEDYDPQVDPSVRVNFSRLRKAVDAYYSGSGAAEKLRIELPKGAYRPIFLEHGSSSTVVPLENSKANSGSASDGISKWVLALAGLVLLLLGVGYVAYMSLNPTVDSLKSTQLTASKIMLVVGADPAKLTSNPSSQQAKKWGSNLRESLSRNAALQIVRPEVGKSDKSLGADFSITTATEVFNTEEQITIELSNAHTGAVVWARSYRAKPDLDTEGQKTLAQKATRELYTQIFGASIEVLEGRDPETLNAEQLFVLATWVPGPAKSTLAWEKERVRLARLALKKDPEFGPAYSVLADKLAYLATVDASSNSEEALAESKQSAARAMELSPRNANAVFNVAQSQWHAGLVKDSVRSMARVLELDPSFGLARFLRDVTQHTCSRAPDEAMQKAIDFDGSLAPDNPVRWVTLTWLGWLHLSRGELELALEAEMRAAQIFQIPHTFMRRAVILNELGRPNEAAEVLKQQAKNWPNSTPNHFATVSLPRLCQTFDGEKAMIGYYENLDRALSSAAN